MFTWQIDNVIKLKCNKYRVMFMCVALLINLNQMYLNKHDSCKLIKGEEWSNSVICPSQVSFTSIKVVKSQDGGRNQSTHRNLTFWE